MYPSPQGSFLLCYSSSSLSLLSHTYNTAHTHVCRQFYKYVLRLRICDVTHTISRYSITNPAPPHTSCSPGDQKDRCLPYNLFSPISKSLHSQWVLSRCLACTTGAWRFVWSPSPPGKCRTPCVRATASREATARPPLPCRSLVLFVLLAPFAAPRTLPTSL